MPLWRHRRRPRSRFRRWGRGRSFLSILVLRWISTLELLRHVVGVLAIVDVVSELHDLSLAAARADPIVLVEVPDVLARRLSEKALTWNRLPGHLQRALLWDSGLVLTSDSDSRSSRLRAVQVHVPCGKTMNQIFLSKDVFDPQSCPIEACNQKSLRFATSSCAIAAVQQVAQCAIEEPVETPSRSSLWAEDGTIETVPDIRVYRYTTPNTGNGTDRSSDYMFTLNQESAPFKTPQNCPAKAFFIVPCTVRSSENAGDWCPPSRGGFVDVWIDNEFGMDGHRGISATTVAMLVFAIITCIGCAVVWIYFVRRRRRYRDSLATMIYTTADMPIIMSGKSDEGMAAVVPLPMRTSSNREFPLVNDVDALYDQRPSEEIRSLQSDYELMRKRIPYSSLTFIKLIARGANGEVWRAEHSEQIVAIKTLLPEKRHDRAAIEMFAKEIRLASCLEHRNIVRFIGLSWNKASDLCSVSEYMPRGDLSDLMSSKQSGRLKWSRDKLCIAIDIASALVYLHSLVPAIIHRDLKSHNILLSDDLQAKLSDFGLSRERSFEETMTNGIGTLLWTAPEILRGEAYTEKADIFSYGIVLMELDTCLPPYALHAEVRERQLTSMQLIHLVSEGALGPQLRPDCPAELQELARACVTVRPADRPSAAQIVLALRTRILPALLSTTT